MPSMPGPGDPAPGFTLNNKIRVKGHAESVFQACCDLS